MITLTFPAGTDGINVRKLVDQQSHQTPIRHAFSHRNSFLKHLDAVREGFLTELHIVAGLLYRLGSCAVINVHEDEGRDLWLRAPPFIWEAAERDFIRLELAVHALVDGLNV
jgi:hypothetical protein